MAPSSVAEEMVVERQPAAEALQEVDATQLPSRWVDRLLAQRSLVSHLRVRGMPRRSLGMDVTLCPLCGKFQSRTCMHGTPSLVPVAQTAQQNFLLHTGTVLVSKEQRPRRLRQAPRRQKRRRLPQYSPASTHSALNMQRLSLAITVLLSLREITLLQHSSTNGIQS